MENQDLVTRYFSSFHKYSNKKNDKCMMFCQILRGGILNLSQIRSNKQFFLWVYRLGLIQKIAAVA